MNTAQETNHRREFLIAATAAVTATAAGPALAASGHDHHKHHGGGNKALASAMSSCVETGRPCVAHCLILLGEGDTEMQACAQSVNDMMPVCEATAVLAVSGSKHLHAQAETCLAACKDCAAECDKHRKEHAECDDCYNSCQEAITAIEAMLKAS